MRLNDMKKLFSILLMAALLVTCITPALYSSAADVPSFVVEENTEYDENASTVDVSFGIADNPGISEMTVLVYYLGDQMSVAGVTSGDYFEAEEGATGESTSNRFDEYFTAPEFEEGTVYTVTEVDLFSTTDGDEAGNGTILNVTFNLDGEHAAGTEFTYGIKVAEAENSNGDAIAFAGKAEGKVTSLPDPYKEVYDNFTVFTTEANVDLDATEATVELRLVNNPGIKGLIVYIVYDEELEMTSLETVDGIFFADVDRFTYNEDLHAYPPTDGSPSNITNAFENMGIPVDGSKVCAVLLANAAANENKTADGVLARLTFKLPEDLQQGESFPIDFCWKDGDIIQLSDTEVDEFGNPALVRLNPDRPTCYINVASCEHPNLVLETVKEPTCTEEGLQSGVCPDCNQTVEVVIPKLDHTPAAEKKVVEPTCTEPGYLVTVCSVCNTEISREVDPDHPEALGHEPGAPVVTKPATCTEEGTQEIYCTRCGEVMGNVEIPMIPHNYVATIIPPTENSQGYTLHACSVCGDNYKDHYTDYVGEDVPQIIIENKTATAGETVTVNLFVKNNPGFNAASFKIDYDTTSLHLIGAELSEEFSSGTTVSYDNLPYLTFFRGGNISSDTNMLTLTFAVLDTASAGDAYISLLYEEGNISNIDEESINFKVVDGKIMVTDYLPGDINGDGSVNTKDLTRLLRYINHEDVECTEKALDVNGDGRVNSKDLTRLLKYINHEDVEIF